MGFKVVEFITETQIKEAVQRLAGLVNEDYRGLQGELVIVGILKGSYMFLSDLVRRIEIPHRVDFLSISSYGEKGAEQGEIKLLLDTSQNLGGKHVLIVEDIVDTGNTIRYLRDLLKNRGVASLKICALLRKQHSDENYLPTYCGFEIPSEKWVVGYGLDFMEQYRSLADIRALEEVS